MSASSRSLRKRDDRLEAKKNSVSAPTPNAISVTATSCSSARLLSDTMACVVSSTITAPTTVSPTHTGFSAVRIAVRPSGALRQRHDGVPSSARSISRPPNTTSFGITSSAGRRRRVLHALEHELQHRAHAAFERAEREVVVERDGRGIEIARGGDQPQAAVDDPDARPRAREPGDEQLDFLRYRSRDRGRTFRGGRRAQFKQARPVLQRGGDRARAGDHRLHLVFAQQALHRFDVRIADPRDHQQHQRDDGELRADAQT